ncbi:hypothetical protein B0T17DRAFT_214493 [Bombardia bombarda]|uniref:Secreted protein n=1 Tax=Bombardia bombarda TaxID=252184 RepID=A0AA39XBG3_9PEZI|nr:hypothetical protein B0T17DRAFT_214493 [Bombardia bombarda]
MLLLLLLMIMLACWIDVWSSRNSKVGPRLLSAIAPAKVKLGAEVTRCGVSQSHVSVQRHIQAPHTPLIICGIWQHHHPIRLPTAAIDARHVTQAGLHVKHVLGHQNNSISQFSCP